MRDHHEPRLAASIPSWATLLLCWMLVTLWLPMVGSFDTGHVSSLLGGRSVAVTLGAQSPHTTTAHFMIGNLVAGVSGIPPKQLLDTGMQKTLVEGTSLGGNVELECAYKGSRDGWSAMDFHRQVDGRGSGLVVALSRSGTIFGGFNPLGWRSTDDYYGSNAAFLWYAKGGKPSKLPILIGGNAAVFDFATGGPNFGPADLVIGPPQAAVMGGFAGPDMEDTRINAGNLRKGSSIVGGAYEAANGWPVRGEFSLTEIEVYCNADLQLSMGGSSPSWWPF